MRTVKFITWAAICFLSGLLSYLFYPEDPLPEGARIDRIIVYKSERKLLAYENGQLLKTYKIALGGEPVGAKEYEGDEKTPEGLYYIHDKNPDSRYHKNLGVSYPDQNDTERAKLLGRPPGGDIKIHGLRNDIGFIGKLHRWSDWTLGCIALTNEEIDELYQSVRLGIPVEIHP